MAEKSVFVDANIIMYTVGAEHPLKKPCRDIVRRITEGEIDAVADTEVFQEILYRYWAQKKLSAGISTYNDFRGLVSLVYAITADDMDKARDLLAEFPRLTPRDAVHAAVMHNNDIREIYTADRHFDELPKIRRLGP